MLFQIPGVSDSDVSAPALSTSRVPLPLLSYGGSALVANLLAIGVLLACARREPEARKLLAKKAMRPSRRMTAVVGSRTSHGRTES